MKELISKFKALQASAKVAVVAVPLVVLSILSCGCCCLPLGMYGNSDGVKQRAKEREEAKEAAIPLVNAQDLLRAYADNEARAEKQYGKGRIKVRGTATSIFAGAVHLERFPVIVCHDLRRDELATVQVGNEITVEGHVTLGNAGGIWLGNCKLK